MKMHWWATIAALYQPSLTREYQNKYQIISNINEPPSKTKSIMNKI